MSSAATTRVREALARQPRVPLATLPTPLHDAVRFRDALGGSGQCPRILIKRDDLTTLGLGGNKARKLEYLVADAQAQGATTLITTGAVQSNHARMTAAAACVAGMRCVLVLTVDAARCRRSPATCCSTSCTAPRFGWCRRSTRCLPSAMTNRWSPRWWREEHAAGRMPYVIPVGGSSGVGVFGYVSGSAELVDQLRDAGVTPSRLYYASGSRGTQAGPDAWREVVRGAVPGVRGSGQRRRAGEDRARETDRQRGRDAAWLTGAPGASRILITDQTQIGEGYGIPTEAALEAIALLARTEAILLDPCYTSKGNGGTDSRHPQRRHRAVRDRGLSAHRRHAGIVHGRF